MCIIAYCMRPVQLRLRPRSPRSPLHLPPAQPLLPRSPHPALRQQQRNRLPSLLQLLPPQPLLGACWLQVSPLTSTLPSIIAGACPSPHGLVDACLNALC